MKRLILFIAAAALFLSSCEAPITNSNQPATNQPLPEAAAPNITYSSEAVQPDTTRRELWEQFRAANGTKWKVRWNKHTGLPAAIFSGLSDKKYRGDAEQAARAFLSEHKALLGVAGVSNLEYKQTQTHRGVRHATFNQTVRGVPVYEAEYQVHLRGDGRVDMVNGDYYPNIEISTSAGISQSQARSTAASDLKVTDTKNLQVQANKVIYGKGEDFHLAWKLVLFQKKPFIDWFYMVDAQSGEILEKHNRLTDVTGDGDVYPTHPGLSSVTNKALYGLNGNGRLNGTYVKVKNASASRAYSASHSFQYATTSTHFDEVSLYYHIDNFRRNFVEALDANNNLFNKLHATAHDNSTCYGGNNACYSESTGNLYFSDAYEFAKEDKVVHHEYGHAVVNDIKSSIDTYDNEEGAINEGVPDYFAGSFTGRPEILEYAASFASRDMSDPHYTDYWNLPRDQNGDVDLFVYTGAEFFSAVLWDLRSEIGASTTDFLVYDALYRITGNPDFMDFRDAMMAADDAAYSGNNNDDIQDAFADYGIGQHVFSGPSTPANLSITNAGSQGFPNLDWDDNPESDLDYYKVYRVKKRLNDGYLYPPVLLGSPTSSSFTDSGIIMSTGNPNDYRYYVYAINPDGTSLASNVTQWVNANTPF